MVRINYCKAATAGTLLLIVLSIGPSAPPARGAEASQPAEADAAVIAREAERIARSIQVSVQDQGAWKAIPLLPGPLLKYEDRPGAIYACGSLWAWGTGGRPEAVLSLCVTPFPQMPSWCHEIVSLSRHPVRAATRGDTWWCTQRAGWSPQAIPNAPAPAEYPEERLAQMKQLARRFTGIRQAWQAEGTSEMPMLPEPILRYPKPAGDALDGALFVFVQATKDPEILLVIEAEKQASGGAAWKFHAAPFSANGLRLRLDGKDVWSRPEIGVFSTQPADLYRIRFTSAKEEIEQSQQH